MCRWMCVCLYIYIYIKRERERERELWLDSLRFELIYVINYNNKIL
jgi:hypothetical protein